MVDLMMQCVADPLRHVMLSYPRGSGQLRDREPAQWHREFLYDLQTKIQERNFDGVNPVEPIRFSTASGHGIGKSALVAMLIRFILDTRPYSKGIVTANTGEQLRTKTWGELAKWGGVGLTKCLVAAEERRGGVELSTTSSIVSSGAAVRRHAGRRTPRRSPAYMQRAAHRSTSSTRRRPCPTGYGKSARVVRQTASR